jgi:DNA-binding Lrp family transcriptional regulator
MTASLSASGCARSRSTLALPSVERGVRQDAHSTPTGRKLAVSEAAEVLGISAEAVRSRLKRGTLRNVKEGDHVYVLLSADQAAPEHQPGADQSADRTEILERLIARLEHDLEQANERDRENRRIIAALTQRIPAIEAPESAEPRPATGCPYRRRRRGSGGLRDA